jgi:hypothetical protein
VIRPRTFQTRWLVPSFATGDSKHPPIPWRPDGKVAEQRKDAANDRGRSRASGSAVVAPAGCLLRGAQPSKTSGLSRILVTFVAARRSNVTSWLVGVRVVIGLIALCGAVREAFGKIARTCGEVAVL